MDKNGEDSNCEIYLIFNFPILISVKASFKTILFHKESDKSDVGTDEEFDDGLDEDLVGDDDDRKKLAGMTEREREEELFKRAEKREEARKRFVMNKFCNLSSTYSV